MSLIRKMENSAKEQKEFWQDVLNRCNYMGLGMSRTECIDLIGYYRGKQEAFEMMAEMVESQK